MTGEGPCKDCGWWHDPARSVCGHNTDCRCLSCRDRRGELIQADMPALRRWERILERHERRLAARAAERAAGRRP